MKFAKLIELENDEQVLACIGIDDGSDDGYRLSFVTDVDGVTVKLGLGWDTEKQRDDYLENSTPPSHNKSETLRWTRSDKLNNNQNESRRTN